MASDLAILLRVLPMFNDDPGDSSDIAEELAHVLGSEGQGRSQRRARTTNLPTVQRRASKLASLPTSTAAALGESLAMRRASVENMTDNIVEAIRQASGKAKGGRTANKGPGRPSNKGRRQSLGQPRHSTAQSNLFEARRNSSALGLEPPGGDENRDSPESESFEAVSLETLLEVLPKAAKMRWADILNVADLEISKPRFISKIAHAIRQKTAVVHLGASLLVRHRQSLWSHSLWTLPCHPPQRMCLTVVTVGSGHSWSYIGFQKSQRSSPRPGSFRSPRSDSNTSPPPWSEPKVWLSAAASRSPWTCRALSASSPGRRLTS